MEALHGDLTQMSSHRSLPGGSDAGLSLEREARGLHLWGAFPDLPSQVILPLFLHNIPHLHLLTTCFILLGIGHLSESHLLVSGTFYTQMLGLVLLTVLSQ